MQSAAWGSVLLDIPVCTYVSIYLIMKRLQHSLLSAGWDISLNCQLLVFASGSPERNSGSSSALTSLRLLTNHGTPKAYTVLFVPCLARVTWAGELKR